MKIYEPNYTQIPNAIISMMPKFTESEFKVVMAICRKTLGWQKKRDRISLSQLQEMTGLGRASVCKAIKSDNFKGIVKTYALDKGNEYELLIHELGSTKSEPPNKEVVQNLNQGSMNSEPIGSMNSEHTKETNKQTIQKRESTRINGVPLPDGFTKEERSWIKKYVEYLKENHQYYQTSMQTEISIGKLIQFKRQGHNPVDVIKTVIEGNHKKLYKPDNYGTDEEQVEFTSEMYDQLYGRTQ